MHDRSVAAAPHAPNPRRVAAGKRNGPLRGPLSEAARQRLREAALRNKPWEKSTGPRTAEGRARCGRHARSMQIGPLSVREVRAELAGVTAQIKAMREARAAVARLLQGARRKRKGAPSGDEGGERP